MLLVNASKNLLHNEIFSSLMSALDVRGFSKASMMRVGEAADTLSPAARSSLKLSRKGSSSVKGFIKLTQVLKDVFS